MDWENVLLGLVTGLPAIVLALRAYRKQSAANRLAAEAMACKQYAGLVQELRQEVDRLRVDYERQIDDLRAEVMGLKQRVKELEQENACLRLKNRELTAQLDRLEGDGSGR